MVHSKAAEKRYFVLFSFSARDCEELHFSGFAVAGFDGVDDAGADVGADGESVDEDEDGLGEVEFEERLGSGEFHDLVFTFGAGLEEAVVAATAEFGETLFQGFGEVEVGGDRGFLGFDGFLERGFLELGGVGFLFDRGHLHWLELSSASDDGEEGVGAGAFWKGEECRDDLVDGVVLDDAAAVEAGDGAAAGVEEAEVVVDLGCGGDGGAGVAGLVFGLIAMAVLFVHVVDVGFFDALEELAGVGGEGFDVAALAFGVDGVEGERGLARPADTADDGEGVVGYVDVDALQVVGAGSANCDLVEV